ncbi:hypothetical protein RMN56_29305 [Micromonospora halotolerans]|uniref:Tripartite tricarboxylate transporter TctB family protein n=1 Tax=Micromonospora halotolerans TaxID=709879 RepID=A0ABY9ZVF5_9ACTN|nr:hypothetical protein [Micromonospora halotolerans]WNM39170.1 hypothetical protein RMN56_29305 [Micromonospora halotolerans]
MTTHLDNPTATSTQRRPNLAVVGAVGGSVAALLAMISTAVDSPFRPKEGPTSGQWGIFPDASAGEVAAHAGIALLAAVVVFAVAARVALRQKPGSTAVWSLVLAILGLPTGIVVYWSGLPAALGIAAIVLGLDARRRLGRLPASAAVGIGLGAIVLIANSMLVFAS